MSEQLHLIANSSFPLSDQNIQKNQKFTQPKREGELLIQLGLASLVDGEQTSSTATKTAAKKAATKTAAKKAATKRAPRKTAAKKTATKRTGRRYQRRDMTAQD